jgi:CRP-like cAMP-binding protein
VTWNSVPILVRYLAYPPHSAISHIQCPLFAVKDSEIAVMDREEFCGLVALNPVLSMDVLRILAAETRAARIAITNVGIKRRVEFRPPREQCQTDFPKRIFRSEVANTADGEGEAAGAFTDGKRD